MPDGDDKDVYRGGETTSSVTQTLTCVCACVLSDGDDKDVYRGGETTSSVAQSTLSGSDPQLNKRSSSVQGDSDAASPGATTPAVSQSKWRH